MGWQDLLQRDDEFIIAPWVGGPVRHGQRDFRLDCRMQEHGWYKFKVQGQKLCCPEPADPQELKHLVVGYLVGDLLVSDWDGKTERVHLLERSLDRFSRVSAGRAYEGGPLIYRQQEFPLEPDVFALNYFLDHKDAESPPEPRIKGAAPALYEAIKLELFQRAEVRRRRAEIEKRLREEEEARQREERRQNLVKQLGDGAGRREMAQVDFEAAAKAALTVGGAEYLDHRAAGRHYEVAVRYRLDGRRYECTCNTKTLQIIDSGICLTAHGGGGFAAGTKGDTWFTLESLPSVIREAIREGKLVVYRHVDTDYPRGGYDEDEEYD